MYIHKFSGEQNSGILAKPNQTSGLLAGLVGIKSTESTHTQPGRIDISLTIQCMEGSYSVVSAKEL